MGESRNYKDVAHTRICTTNYLSLWYSLHVLRLNMTFMWRCPTESVQLLFFSENFSRRHLNCGVANGWFIFNTLSRPFRINV